MRTYLAVYLGSALVALLVTPLSMWLACRIKAVDRPGIRTIHERPTPRLGGLSIFLATMCLIVCVLFLDNKIGEAFRDKPLQLVSLLCTATCIFLIGLIDDIRGLPARFKFLAEIVAAGTLCYVGVQIKNVAITDTIILDMGWFAWPLTVLWIVGITNAVNLSDGLDGLAAGVSAVACAVIAIFAIHSSNNVMAVFMLALLGGLSGFLFFNFNPAKIFMGDCGSLFVGYTIASSSVMCMTKSSALVGLALPVLALGIPIFDTFFCMLRRFLERRPLFAPDRRHFHHRLIELGLKQQHAVIAIYAATCLSTGLGLFMMVRRDIGALVLLGCILFLVILLFRVVGAVRFRDTILRLQEKHAIARQQKQEKKIFEHFQLRFRRTQGFPDWWEAVCEAADSLDFTWVSLTTTMPNGNTQTTVWRENSSPAEKIRVITVTFPMTDAVTQQLSEFEIAVKVNGSLESASHRAGLFSRLLDETSLGYSL